MNTDYIYWTFTAAAQCVSTFVALLLTGYALVLSQIEAARDRDDSLQDIHTALRQSYHRRLTLLAWLTALAVLLSLGVVWVNRSTVPAPAPLMVLAALADLVAMIAGLAFVVTIIDPAKYQKAAERELEQQQHQLAEATGTPPQEAPASDFFRAFRRLERQLRELCEAHGLHTDAEADNRRRSLRGMTELLQLNEVLGDELAAELLQINRYRNLLFHGGMQEADAAMLERVRAATSRLKPLRPGAEPRTPATNLL